MNQPVKKRRVDWGCLALVAGVAVVLLVPPILYRTSAREEEFTVQSKDMASRDGTPQFLVFTDRGVYESKDSHLFLKYNSADVYGRFEPGQTYKVRVAGWRVPFFSWFPNIIDVK